MRDTTSIPVKAKKSLGQNFLMHARTAERIADAANLKPEDTVLEIGPGTGMLTRALLKRARVVAIEADRDLFESLQKEFAVEIGERKLDLRYGDIRALDFNTLPKDYRVVANIPYYITGEIMRMFFESAHQPASMTLLVQKEVAERIARSKKESLLSLSIKAYGTPKYMFTVPRGAFVPAPNVDSAVLTITDITRKNFSTKKEEEKFFALIHAGFAHKRKMLGGNLSEIGFTAPKQFEKSRAEDLTLTDWLSFIG